MSATHGKYTGLQWWGDGDPWKIHGSMEQVGPALVVRTLGKMKDLTVYNKLLPASKVRPLK